MTDAPEQEAVGEWLSVRDAAARLGITERSIFRRMQKGVLEKRTQLDGSVMVRLTARPAETDIEPLAVMSEDDPQQRVLADGGVILAMFWFQQALESTRVVVDNYRSMIDERNEKVTQQAEEIGRLRAELAMRRQPWWRRLTGAPVMTPS